MLRFGRCALDVDARRLLVDGEPVHLEPQAFDVLVHLARQGDRVVPRDELLNAVWGSSFVTDAALATRIKEIRRATGDDGTIQQVVRTVRGRGYCLVPEVHPDARPDPAPSGPIRSGQVGPSLVGRDRDLAEVIARLRPGAVVCLVGPGGVGKSTLARAVAAGWQQAGHRVLPVDLVPVTDPAQLLPAVARAAGVTGDDPEAALSRLAALLVLDDADELVDAVSALCSRLVGGGRLAVLVTCRERLGCRGEQLWPVLPLEAGSSRTLLRDRARELAPLGGLAEADDDVLDGLADAVDRLPLALEILAAASAVVDAGGLHDLLREQPELLSPASRQVPVRHRTLDRLAAVSVERVDGVLLDTLVGLTAFAGAFTATDAAGVLGPTAPALLRNLVDRSLLCPVPGLPPRFQVLRTVARAVAAVTGPATVQEAAGRHAELVLRTLAAADDQLRGPDEAAAAAEFDRLADEARAAVRWSLTHRPRTAAALIRSLHLYAYTRMWDEPFAWAQALAATLPAPEVLAALATRAAVRGRLDRAAELAEQVLAVTSEPRLQGLALEVLADIHLYRSQTGPAIRRAQELTELGHRSGDPHLIALGRTNDGCARAYAGRAAEVEAVLAARGLPADLAPSDRAWLTFARGEALAALGDPEAGPTLDRAVALAESVGNLFIAGVARVTQADLARRGDPTEAAAVFREVVEVFARRGNVTHLTAAMRLLVPVVEQLGAVPEAVVLASWAGSAGVQAGAPAEMAALHRTVEAHRDLPGWSRWCARGPALTAAEAADVALAALARFAPGPAHAAD